MPIEELRRGPYHRFLKTQNVSRRKGKKTKSERKSTGDLPGKGKHGARGIKEGVQKQKKGPTKLGVDFINDLSNRPCDQFTC